MILYYKTATTILNLQSFVKVAGRKKNHFEYLAGIRFGPAQSPVGTDNEIWYCDYCQPAVDFYLGFPLNIYCERYYDWFRKGMISGQE